MGTLHVGNLAYETTDVNLKTAFSPFGKVISVKIVSAVAGEAGDEEVFFIEATSPEYDRRALTVHIED